MKNVNGIVKTSGGVGVGVQKATKSTYVMYAGA